MFEWVPRTLIGFLAPVGGAHGVDLAGFALGQVKVLSRKVHCMSLSSIHILYNQAIVGGIKPLLRPARQIVNLQLDGGSTPYYERASSPRTV